MLLSPNQIHQVAKRILADYDAHCPNEIFAEYGVEWLTMADAYAVQRAVAKLRMARGERSCGYKIGCVSSTIQNQFGLCEPVRGYVWQSELLMSGCRLAQAAFANLAIEGEIALCLSRAIPKDIPADEVLRCVEYWFPVIELHHFVFRGKTPTSQELVAGNAMHAGIVARDSARHHLDALAGAEIRVEINRDLVEVSNVRVLPGGPLGSLRWLAASLAGSTEDLKAGDIVLTGSPGRLIRVGGHDSVEIICDEERVQLSVEPTLG